MIPIRILSRDELAREPSTRYTAVHDSGHRLRSQIRHIVLHTTEGPTAEGAAAYFTNPSSGGSAHIVVDETTAFRTLDDLEIAWGAPPLNKSGLHLEQAGSASWSRLKWLAHVKTVQRAAYQSALWCDRYAIAPRWLYAADLLRDPQPSGITTHRAVSAAFKQTDHTDPGPNYPISTFMWFLNRYLA